MAKITLEEAIRNAEQGDINCMRILGDYYAKQNTGDGLDKAAKWYEQAAQRHDLYSMFQLVLCKTTQALAGDSVIGKVEYAIEFAEPDWDEAYSWSKTLLHCLDEGKAGSEAISIDRAKVIKHFNDASYQLALHNYHLNNYAKALTVLENQTDTRARVLYGACLAQTANTPDDYKAAYNYLALIDKNRSYSAADKYASAEKTMLEEQVYVIAAVQLSIFYRNGIATSGGAADLNAAVSLLESVFPFVQRDDNKQFIENEWRHYQKKLFGGYKYIP